MGLGLILDDVCVFVGLVVVWLAKGGKGSRAKELGTFKLGGLYSGRLQEGMIGFGTLAAAGGLVWAAVHFRRGPH